MTYRHKPGRIEQWLEKRVGLDYDNTEALVFLILFILICGVPKLIEIVIPRWVMVCFFGGCQ